jgi:hypothetical protein
MQSPEHANTPTGIKALEWAECFQIVASFSLFRPQEKLSDETIKRDYLNASARNYIY